MTTSISRRSVARGAAWSIPAVAVAGAAPAMAASNCSPTLRFQGGVTYDYGAVGSSSPIKQSMTAGGQTYVDGLPAGVTVVAVFYEMWIQNRIGQNSYGPGAFWIGNRTSNWASSCNGGSGTCKPMTYTAASTGWTGQVTSLGNLVSQTYSAGTFQMWNLHFDWKAGSGAGSYTNVSGCSNFTTGPSGRFPITYTGVTSAPTCSDPDVVVNNFVDITVTLSNGQTLTGRSPSNGNTQCRP